MAEETDSSLIDETDLPSLQELREDVVSETGESLAYLRARHDQAALENEQSYAKLAGLKRHYSHKALWSLYLMVAMAAMIGFQSYLLYMVGSGQWSFLRYEWLLPALLVQNLAQIAGLCVIVVKALFTEFK